MSDEDLLLNTSSSSSSINNNRNNNKEFTPLLAQQMGGRAGRRGIDKSGNIVYYGMDPYQLLKGNLPVIAGKEIIYSTMGLFYDERSLIELNNNLRGIRVDIDRLMENVRLFKIGEKEEGGEIDKDKIKREGLLKSYLWRTRNLSDNNIILFNIIDDLEKKLEGLVEIVDNKDEDGEDIKTKEFNYHTINRTMALVYNIFKEGEQDRRSLEERWNNIEEDSSPLSLYQSFVNNKVIINSGTREMYMLLGECDKFIKQLKTLAGFIEMNNKYIENKQDNTLPLCYPSDNIHSIINIIVDKLQYIVNKELLKGEFNLLWVPCRAIRKKIRKNAEDDLDGDEDEGDIKDFIL